MGKVNEEKIKQIFLSPTNAFSNLSLKYNQNCIFLLLYLNFKTTTAPLIISTHTQSTEGQLFHF